MKKIFSILFIVIIAFLAVFSVNAQEASFYLSPQEGNYEVGKTFGVDVLINSEGAAINAAQAKINFPPAILKVVDISRPDSIFTLWVQEPVWSNERGEISFGGGLPSPGFRGKAGKVMTIFFQGKITGEAKVDFKEEAILENSPQAPNIFSFSQEGNYSIFEPEILKKVPTAPKITSPIHSEPEKWYSNNNPEFRWEIPSNITGVSFAFNQIALFDPGNVSQGVFGSKTLEGVIDGVWYFHLKLQNEAGWSKTSHFKVQIDSTAPHSFEIAVDNEGDPTNPSPLLYFEAKDDTSGISHYEIKIGVGDAFKIFEVETNPFRLPHQAPGVHPVIILAVDMAQNSTESRAEAKVESIPAPEITVCPSVFVSGEEVMYVSGSALPNSQVLAFFKKDEKLAKKWQVTSNETGEWFLVEDGLFKSGLYQITARTINIKGAISYESSPCSVKVILIGVAIGPLVMSYKTLAIIFLIIFILVLAGIFYLLKKIRKSRGLIEKETKDLKQKFYKEYEELRADIERELEELKRARGERAISEAEKEREKGLLKNLADIKEVFEKELKDIEKIK